jgi:hypothetical protein
MSNLRVKISQATNKKVPALALIVVAMLGMVAGVLAATIATTTTNNAGGEQGLLHTTTNVLTIADNGLSAVSVVPTTTNASSTFYTTGNKNAYASTTTFVVGHLVEALLVTDTVGTDTVAHAVKITINQGTTTAPSGSTLVAQFTYTMTGVTGSTNPTITLYIDLGVTSITSPLNIYVTST